MKPPKDRAYAFIVKHSHKKLYFPSIDEIAEELEVSVSRAYKVLDQLIEDGLVEKAARYGHKLVKVK